MHSSALTAKKSPRFIISFLSLSLSLYSFFSSPFDTSSNIARIIVIFVSTQVPVWNLIEQFSSWIAFAIVGPAFYRASQLMPATIISVDGRMHHFETHLCKQIPSVFLSFFPRVLAKQTFARVLYLEIKKKKKRRIDQKTFNSLPLVPFSYHDYHLSRRREKRIRSNWRMK